MIWVDFFKPPFFVCCPKIAVDNSGLNLVEGQIITGRKNRMSSVVKKRRKKITKHKYRKLRKKMRHKNK